MNPRAEGLTRWLAIDGDTKKRILKHSLQPPQFWHHLTSLMGFSGLPIQLVQIVAPPKPTGGPVGAIWVYVLRSRR